MQHDMILTTISQAPAGGSQFKLLQSSSSYYIFMIPSTTTTTTTVYCTAAKAA